MKIFSDCFQSGQFLNSKQKLTSRKQIPSLNPYNFKICIMHHYLGLLNINLQIVYRQSSSNKALRWAESEIWAGFSRFGSSWISCTYFCLVNVFNNTTTARTINLHICKVQRADLTCHMIRNWLCLCCVDQSGTSIQILPEPRDTFFIKLRL